MSALRRQSARSVLWEVLGPYLRWPLYSPQRLGAVVLALVLVLVLTTRVRSGTTHPRPTTTVTVTAAPRASSAGTQPTTDIVDPAVSAAQTRVLPTPSPYVSHRVPNTTTDVAAAFVDAWARRGAEREEWLRGVSITATPAYAAELAGTDPNRIPATRRTEAPVVRSRSPRSATLEVGTDGGPVRVVLTRTNGRWKVSSIAPVDNASAAPTPAMTASGTSAGSSQPATSSTASRSSTPRTPEQGRS